MRYCFVIIACCIDKFLCARSILKVKVWEGTKDQTWVAHIHPTLDVYGIDMTYPAKHPASSETQIWKADPKVLSDSNDELPDVLALLTQLLSLCASRYTKSI